MRFAISRVVFHSMWLIFINITSYLFAQSTDLEFEEAKNLFENRDLVSIAKATIALEKIIGKKSDHLEAQALLSFVYAHQANIARQIGQPYLDYENSASAFSAQVLSVNADHRTALKTNAFLLLSKGNILDAKKIIDVRSPPNETDIDWLYMQAAVSENDKSVQIVSKILSVNASHVWIYFDMSMRSLRLNNLSNAEKWLSLLKANKPDLVEVDILQGVIAAHKNDIKTVQEYSANVLKKLPNSVISKKIQLAMKQQSIKN